MASSQYTKADYQQAVQNLADRHNKAILNFLKHLCSYLKQHRFKTLYPPEAIIGDGYYWSCVVSPIGCEDKDRWIDLNVALCESPDYEGEPDLWEDAGVNWMFVASQWGGRILAQVSPYNYSHKCWFRPVNIRESSKRLNDIMRIDEAELYRCLTQ